MKTDCTVLKMIIDTGLILVLVESQIDDCIGEEEACHVETIKK